MTLILAYLLFLFILNTRMLIKFMARQNVKQNNIHSFFLNENSM
jgi:hypothetical protein